MPITSRARVRILRKLTQDRLRMSRIVIDVTLRWFFKPVKKRCPRKKQQKLENNSVEQ